MKSLNSAADQKKTVGLIVAVILVFGVVVWRVMGAISPPPPDPNAPPATADVIPLGSGAPGIVASNSPPMAAGPDADAQIDAPKFLPSETPNPFHKDTESYASPLPTSDGVAVAQSAPIKPVKKARRRGRKSYEAFNPGMQGEVLPGPGGPGGSLEVHPDVEQMEIMGVITGSKPVAVIRVGEQQFVVDRGDKFGRGMRLKDVTDSQVIIEQGGELHILRVGARPASAQTPVAPSAPIPSSPAPTTPTKSNGIL